MRYNLAFVSDLIYSPIGGSAISTRRFIPLLEKSGFNIYKVTGRERIDYVKLHEKNICTFPSVGLSWIYKDLIIAFPFGRDIRRFLKESNIGLVHFFYPSLLSESFIDSAKKLKIPVISTSHGLVEHYTKHNALLDTRPIKWIIKKKMVSLYNRCDAIIAVSEYGKKKLEEYGIKSKIIVISNGVDRSFFHPRDVRTKIIKKYSFSKDSLLVLTVARLAAEKNLVTIIELAKWCKENGKKVQFLIVGDGYLRDALKRQISDLNLQKYVRLAGRIDDRNDIAEHYSGADIFLLPSTIEIEPLVITEAMASGKPLLLADCEYAKLGRFVNGNGYLFDPNSLEDLQNKLNLFFDRNSRKKMGDASLRLAEKYDITASVSALKKTYVNFIKKSGKIKKR
jgi:glycosyltransferase involved in cell wall biosynthesis